METLLRKLRREKGMSQRELGLYAGWFRGGLVSVIERGKLEDYPTFAGIDLNHALRQFAFALRYEGDPRDLLEEAV